MSAVNWVFTLNNYTANDEKLFQDLEIPFIIYGRETGDNGTPHLQGYLQLDKRKRLTGMKKIHARAHWEPARGSAQDSITYCSKQDPEPFRKGDVTFKGQRTDLEGLRDAIKEAPLTRRQLADDHLKVIARYPRIADYLHDTYHPPIDLDGELDNYWFYGPPGTGKSSTARKEYPIHFSKPANKWFDGYDGQDTVIIEELGPQDATLIHQLKIWSDRYIFMCEFKGSTRQIRPKRIIVTSNYHPSDIFPNTVDVEAILRRFKLREFQ